MAAGVPNLWPACWNRPTWGSNSIRGMKTKKEQFMRDINWHFFICPQGAHCRISKTFFFAIKTSESLSFIHEIQSIYSESSFMDYWPLIITYHLYMRWKLNKLNKFFCPFHWRSMRLFTSPPWQITSYYHWVSSDSRQLCSKLRRSWDKTPREQLFMSRCSHLLSLSVCHPSGPDNLDRLERDSASVPLGRDRRRQAEDTRGRV